MAAKTKKATTDSMMRRLLKAEHNQYTGAIDRLHLRKVADECRKFLKKGKSNG